MSCVLTLALDDASQERFEALRQRHFPPALNRIPAHLSLFHTLPATAETTAVLTQAGQSQAAFPLRCDSVRSLGKGVAYFFTSPVAGALHRRLSAAFQEELSPQDRQGFRPHVVAQNKVTPAQAKETLHLLQAGFAPFDVEAVGLDLWRYLGGPWLHLQRFAFTR